MTIPTDRRTPVRNCLYGFALAALCLSGTARSDPGSPDAVINDAIEELSIKLDGRKDALAADPQALYALIDEILLPRFDRKFAAQLVLAQHWRTADDEQRTRFIDAFYNSLLRKYADGLLEFNEDRIEVNPYRGDRAAKRAVVKTIVTLNDGTTVPVDYDLVNRGDRWLIFNVKVEGVSYVTNYRKELDAEIQASSLTAVIERLEAESGPDKDG